MTRYNPNTHSLLSGASWDWDFFSTWIVYFFWKKRKKRCWPLGLHARSKISILKDFFSFLKYCQIIIYIYLNLFSFQCVFLINIVYVLNCILRYRLIASKLCKATIRNNIFWLSLKVNYYGMFIISVFGLYDKFFLEYIEYICNALSVYWQCTYFQCSFVRT